MKFMHETREGEHLPLSATAVLISTDPKGGCYWRIQYALSSGEVVYALGTKRLPPGHVPGPLEALEWPRTIKRSGEDVRQTNREHLDDCLEELLLPYNTNEEEDN